MTGGHTLPRYEGELILKEVERTYHGHTVAVPTLVDEQTGETFFNPVVADALYEFAQAAKKLEQVCAGYRKGASK